MYEVPALRFDLDAAQAAADSWGFNCGPAALCALLGKTTDEMRFDLPDFAVRGYMSPSMMAAYLRRFGVPYHVAFQYDGPAAPEGQVWFAVPGLMRVQWSGPWCRRGVPVAARYGRTHWVATRGGTTSEPGEVFDINAICSGGWLPWREWSKELVPWLIREGVPRADGRWWPTHCWELISAGDVAAMRHVGDVARRHGRGRR